MMTAAIPVRNQKHSLGSEKWLPSVAVAGSVLLKQRSRNMNAVQLMVTTLIKYTGFHVSFFLFNTKPLLIITNKVQGTRQAYIKNTKTLQKETMQYRMLIYKQKMFTKIESY